MQRCRASISGNCLKMTEGWDHCDDGECELGINWRKEEVEEQRSSYPLISVAWDRNVDPPIPLVCTVGEYGDGSPGVCIYDRNESLRLMWAEIERLRG